MALIIKHVEPLGLIAQLIISIPLHAIIANESLLNGIPSFLSGGEFCECEVTLSDPRLVE